MAKSRYLNAVFDALVRVNVNGHLKSKKIDGEKGKLSYLSWSFAWEELNKRYESVSYSIFKDHVTGKPYVYDEKLGYMVFTSVTIEGVTHEMWLPVLDDNQLAMKAIPYECQTRFGKKYVQPATMSDINRTIMRCLVKNIAMFGLGIGLYDSKDEEPHKISADQVKIVEAELNRTGVDVNMILDTYGIGSIAEMTSLQFANFKSRMRSTKSKKRSEMNE